MNFKNPANEGDVANSSTPVASNTETRGIRIRVRPKLSQENSNAESGVYVYTYHITISNEGVDTVQLMSRHWVIRDGFNGVQHVVGEGVVGQKPIIRPGESFEYSSFCPLQTPTGTMEGSFQMKTNQGEVFDAAIAEFQLKHNDLVN